MNETKYYLSEKCFAEPLVNKWYAWPNLIQPLTYAMYMSKTHQRLMNSFVKNSELHILANSDKSMAGGGEFVDCSAEQVSQVQALLQHFRTESSIYLELSDAIAELDELLRQHTSGESIEPLYEKVPEVLKGYVELVMDMNYQMKSGIC